MKKETISCKINDTLQILTQKDESSTYPINEKDLLVLDPHCPLCGSSKISTISEIYLQETLLFFKTASCRNCFYTFRQISPNELWFKDRWEQIANNKLEVFNPKLEETRKERYETYYNLIKDYIRTGRVLDIGAAYGTGAKYFSDKGFEVEALEPENDRSNYIRNKLCIKTYSCSLNEVPLEKKYDLILFSHCLEHVDDPVAALQKVNELLDSNGILYLEIPILWEIVDWTDSFFMAHKSNFTEENIYSLLEKYGFKIVQKVYQNLNSPTTRDLGLIVVKNENTNFEKIKYENIKSEHVFENVQIFYRRNSTAEIENFDKERILRYNIQSISNFFYIVKHNEGHFKYCDKKDFFEFYPNEK